MYFATNLTKTNHLSLSKEETNAILIASVVKPLDDHRMYEKWGYFFKYVGFINIHIFGGSMEFENKNRVYLHASLDKNTGIKRIFAQIKFLRLLIKIKPKIVVLETFELLIVAFFYKKIGGSNTKFYYDIQENYDLNLQSQKNNARWKIVLISKWIKLSENISKKYIEHYFISELVYQNQLKFISNKNTTLIENLYAYPDEVVVDKIRATYLITGTLSKAYGLDLACKWIRIIKKIHPNAKIKILGHSTDNYKFPKDIKQLAEIEVYKTPISHQRLIEELASSEFLLLPYSWSSSFIGCTPVKLYEALYLETKVICSYENGLTQSICHPLLEFRTEEFKQAPLHFSKAKEIERFEKKYYPILKEKMGIV